MCNKYYDFCLQVKWSYPNSGERFIKVPVIYNDLIKSLATSTEDTIMKKIHAVPSLKNACEDYYCRAVNSEIELYCRKDTPAILRSKGIKENDLKTFSYEVFENELTATTPLFLKVIKAATFNPSHERNKRKTEEAIKPAILSAAAKLINIHTEDMNVHKQITSVIMKKAGLKKMGFARLSKTYDAMSYEHVTELYDYYASQFDKTIKQWMAELQENPMGHPGYGLQVDNVDWEVGRRQMTSTNQKKSVHKINAIAYENRIDASHLPDDGPQRDITAVPLQDMLPGAADNIQLAEHLIVLVGNKWADTIPDLAWWKEHLPSAIEHDYAKEMKKTKTKTQLGLYNYDQKNVDSVEEFLIEMHAKFVPQHDSGDDPNARPTRTMMRGDYLGFERQKCAQNLVQDARTPSKRLEGIISALSDFHAQAAWHKVAWYFLYDTLTGKDVGTLYHTRQVTNSRNVTRDPHDNFYAAEDLLDKFTDAYIIAAALHYFCMDSIDANVTEHMVDKTSPTVKADIVNTIKEFLGEHVLNPPPSLPGDDILKCRFCGKVYKLKKRLDEHEKKHRDLLAKTVQEGVFKCNVCGKVYAKEPSLKKHFDSHSEEEKNQQPDDNGTAGDYVYNYTRRVMSICALRMNFEDAIKKGDGGRVFLCYKFMYLYYKVAKCPKYGYGIFETLCQAYYLLSQRQAHHLVWNRFVNNKGKCKFVYI